MSGAGQSAGMTMLDKIWSKHSILERADGETLLYVDRHLVHDGYAPAFEFLKARGLKPQARCITDSVRVISTLIRGHQAVGVLPEYGCEALLADRRLRATLLPRRRDIWLLVQNHLKRDAAARMAIDWLRECFEGYAKR